MRRKPKVIHFWRGRLPHVQVEDGRYFVTIHVAGAIPTAAQRIIRQRALSLQASAERWNQKLVLAIARKVFGEMEKWLDRSTFAPVMSNPCVANMVLDSLDHRQQKDYWNIFEAVVMPNHLHFFFELCGERSLKTELQQFKRWTARQAASLLHPIERFWQTEWFDHWSRSDEQDERIVRYIANNPVKAGLTSNANEWPYRYPRRQQEASASLAETDPPKRRRGKHQFVIQRELLGMNARWTSCWKMWWLVRTTYFGGSASARQTYVGQSRRD